jgi:NAD(P)H-nitrite reductase large subunit
VILKGTGIDMTAAGRVNPNDGDLVVPAPDEPGYAYGKLVVAAGGKLAGGILLGRPGDAPKLLAAVKQDLDLSDRLGVLRAGDWSALDPRWVPKPDAAAPAPPARVPAGAVRR